MTASRRRSIFGLVGSWVVYWSVIALVKLGPAALAIYRATRETTADAANVSVGLTNAVLNLVVTDRGQTTWSGSVHLAALALWIGAGPLALWAAWLYMRPSNKTSDAAERQRV